MRLILNTRLTKNRIVAYMAVFSNSVHYNAIV